AGVLAEYPEAELVYTGGLLYAYPGVMRSHPDGYLQPCSYSRFLHGLTAPAIVSHATAVECVAAAFRFKATYPFNMQFGVLARSLIDRIAPRGVLFRSPYPDYYAMNVAMARARQVVACPLPLVAVGIS